LKLLSFKIFGETTPFGETLVNQKVTKSVSN